MLGVVGLGYVGCTSFLGFSQFTSKLVGYDLSADLVDRMRNGVLHIHDEEMGEYFKENFSSLNITSEISDLADCTDILIAVPTNTAGGKLDLSIVSSVLEKLSEISDSANLWIRSTLDDPDLFDELSVRLKNPLFLYPEFLREGKCWRDFNNPSISVIGKEREMDGNFLVELIQNNLASQTLFQCSPAEAITLKLACNSFHALKVCFANELRDLRWSEKVDLNKVMEIFVRDDVLNISAAYLKPGLPFGGPCLPKDTLALKHSSNREKNLFSAVLEINQAHKGHWVEKVSALKAEVIGVVGLEFKPNTGDYKNSPVIDIVSSIKNKKIVVLKTEQALSPDLTKFEAVEDIPSLSERVEVILTHDKSFVGPNIIHWDQL